MLVGALADRWCGCIGMYKQLRTIQYVHLDRYVYGSLMVICSIGWAVSWCDENVECCNILQLFSADARDSKSLKAASFCAGFLTRYLRSKLCARVSVEAVSCRVH